MTLLDRANARASAQAEDPPTRSANYAILAEILGAIFPWKHFVNESHCYSKAECDGCILRIHHS
jgi:hypothetical protein